MSLLDYSDTSIAGVIIIGGMSFAFLSVLSLCSLLVWCRWWGEEGRLDGTRRRSNNSLVREQSQSIVRGEHPIAFMLPTVSLSDVGSETETLSDLESLGYQSSRPGSPFNTTSLASLTGSGIYSSAALLAPPPQLSPMAPSTQSLPLEIAQRRPHPRPLSAPPRGQCVSQLAGPLGRISVRVTHRKARTELQVKVLKGEGIPTNYRSQTANISVKLSLLPSRLPKYTTGVVEDTTDPEFNEEFSFFVSREETKGKVLRLTLVDHDREGKRFVGAALLPLEDAVVQEDQAELTVHEAWLAIRESVEPELSRLLADRLQLSLCYDPDPGRLTLGIQEANILSLPPEARDSDIYVKVALFEGKRVIKVKKTRLLACQDRIDFQEQFSIVLPRAYLDSVSCLLSLCSKSRFGTKSVLGRSSVGPYTLASGVGLDQWTEMCRHPGEEIIVSHVFSS